jgi:hypothetical protein
MYVMLVFEMLEFMRALIVIVCGAQIVAPPERSPSVNMFVSVGVYFYDWCECTNAPVVGVLFVFQFRKTHKKQHKSPVLYNRQRASRKCAIILVRQACHRCHWGFSMMMNNQRLTPPR